MTNYVQKHDKLMRYLDMTIETATPEYSKVTMPITENHKNGMGVAHGGAIFALADVAFGSAANAGKTCGVVSLNSSIEFLRPGKVSPLTAEAFVVRDGKHILSYDVKVHDGSGALVARCMCAGFQTEIPLPE